MSYDTVSSLRISESTLVNRNVVVNGRRTSVRLEPEFWEALSEIACREGTSINSIVGRVDSARAGGGLTSSLRVFVLSYFRHAATERGHLAAGHGTLFIGPAKLWNRR